MKRNHNILLLYLCLSCFIYILYLITYRKRTNECGICSEAKNIHAYSEGRRRSPEEYEHRIESFTNNIQYVNWWSSDTKNYTDLFQNIFVDTKYKNIKIYSVFPPENLEKTSKDKDTLYVQFSGESIYGNPDNYDINFIPTDKIQSNVIIFPYALFHILLMKVDLQKLVIPRSLSKSTQKQHFCLFSVSNGAAEERKEFFIELSKYKKVDSCGRFMNNMNKSCPNDHESSEYFDFISTYKFMICFENTSLPNYLTEKIVNAYYSGTIPIYWGCPNIGDYVNMDSILYLPQKYTQEERDKLIEKILFLDTYPDAYKAMYEQSFFKNGILPDEFDIEKIKEKINKIM